MNQSPKNFAAKISPLVQKSSSSQEKTITTPIKNVSLQSSLVETNENIVAESAVANNSNTNMNLTKNLIRNLLNSVETKNEEKKSLENQHQKDAVEYKTVESEILKFMEENNTDRVLFKDTLYTRIKRSKMPRIYPKAVVDIVKKEYGEEKAKLVQAEIKRLNKELCGEEECLLLRKKNIKVKKTLVIP